MPPGHSEGYRHPRRGSSAPLTGGRMAVGRPHADADTATEPAAHLPDDGASGWSSQAVFTIVDREGIRPMSLQMRPAEEFRFGGHQTFPPRIAWLPKAALGLSRGQDVLGNIVDGVVGLGLGKNNSLHIPCSAGN